ncbi:hypothetical protein K435DRAFT_598246, partial [Dendrothele bispora CBS 962.96]
IPEWDGDTDALIVWLNKIDSMFVEEPLVAKQFGRIVPRRLTGKAETWYYSLSLNHRRNIEGSWEELKKEIINFWMNRKWVEKMRKRARETKYRESGHSRETPGEYFLRKNLLLANVYELTDAEVISEIMAGAPSSWNTILNKRSYVDVDEFQTDISLHEDTLAELD